MDRRLEKIIKYFRENAIATSVATGAVAGLPPDNPPVKKKKQYIYGGHGSRRMWLANKKNGK